MLLKYFNKTYKLIFDNRVKLFFSSCASLNRKYLSEMNRKEMIMAIESIEEQKKSMANFLNKQKGKVMKPKDTLLLQASRHSIAISMIVLSKIPNYGQIETTLIEKFLQDAMVATHLINGREEWQAHWIQEPNTFAYISHGTCFAIIKANLNLESGVGNPLADKLRNQSRDEIRYAQVLNKALPKGVRIFTWAPILIESKSHSKLSWQLDRSTLTEIAFHFCQLQNEFKLKEKVVLQLILKIDDILSHIKVQEAEKTHPTIQKNSLESVALKVKSYNEMTPLDWSYLASKSKYKTFMDFINRGKSEND